MPGGLHGGIRSPWQNSRHKKASFRGWKQEQVTWEECRDTVQTCKDEVRKAKALMGVNLAREDKDSKKGFCNYIGDKKSRENVGPLLKGWGSW